MQKQTVQSNTNIVEKAEQVGAGLLAALAMVVSVELMLEHAPAKAGHHGKRGDHSIMEVFSRGEGKGETARLPEEFDVGLQSPNIAGA